MSRTEQDITTIMISGHCNFWPFVSDDVHDVGMTMLTTDMKKGKEIIPNGPEKNKERRWKTVRFVSVDPGGRFRSVGHLINPKVRAQKSPNTKTVL